MSEPFVYAIPNSKRNPIEEDFEIKDQLGDGQYSVVKMGVNRKTAQEVAIKFVHRSQTEASELINEVELMREVSEHPGFVKLLDVYEDEKHYILVLDLVRGGELFDKIAQLTTYTEERVANLLFQIAAALDFMHSKKIVHRDIKPENLLFEDTAATVIKLCDFGVAEKIPEKGYLTEIIGTESYMAPEVEQGKQYGLPSDMYGLGIITYIMLCGYPPFEPENGITELEFPEEEWAEISDSVKELITSLLENDPALRPTAEQVMRHPWVRGDKQTNKENLHGTLNTMKIYNEYRASGNFSSMRAIKGSKMDVVWSLFGGGSSPGGTPNSGKKLKAVKVKSPKAKRAEQNEAKKSKVQILSKKLKKIDEHNDQPSNSPSVTKITLPPPIQSPPRTVSVSTGSTTDATSTEIMVGDKNEEMVQTVFLLEGKLVSLTNINCALQSQIDEMNAAYNKLKSERDDFKSQRDDMKKDFDDVTQELEALKLKKEKKKKEEKEKKKQ